MKFMNNHYGQSLIFKHARRNAPDMGDVGGDGGSDGDGSGGGSGDNGDGDGGDNGGSNESIEELRLQLAKAQAERERYKNSVDNLTKKNSELTKKNRQFMSDEQRQQADQEARDQELEELKKKVRVGEYSKRLISFGMSEKEADELAESMPAMEDSDLFFDALGSFIESIKKTSGEEAVQKLLKDRPDINAGNGDKKSTVAEDKAVAIAKKAASRAASNNIVNYYKR